MTIAMGLVSPKGLIVCSDSLESTAPGYGKGYVTKVGMHPTPEGTLFFAAAGYAGPAVFIETEILDALSAEKAPSLDRSIASVRRIVRDYYQDHIWPTGQPSTFGAVIGLRYRDTFVLLKTDCDSTVTRCRDYACVGIGAKPAERAARLVLGASNPTGCVVASFNQLVAIGAYCVWLAKETIDGCGGPTQMVGLEKGVSIGTPFVALDVLEKAFDEIATRQAVVLHRLLSTHVGPAQVCEDFQTQIANARAYHSWRRIMQQHEEFMRSETSVPQDSKRGRRVRPASRG